MKHTPGPWSVGEFSDTLGYDCMTAGIKAGPCVLDGSDYGQARCREMNAEARSQMEADARLIAAAHDLLEAAKLVIAWYEAEEDHSKADFYERVQMCRDSESACRAAIAKATGEQQ